MSQQLSAGINISEKDLTTVVPAVATTEGALAGVFQWGPIDKLSLIDSEKKLIDVYGKPNDNNAETWFTAANFLSYGNQLYVGRAASNVASAVATSAANVAAVNAYSFAVKNSDDFLARNSVLTGNADIQFIAKYPGDLGNTLKISVCGSSSQFDSTVDLVTNSSFSGADTLLTMTVGSAQGVITLANSVSVTNTQISNAISTITSSIAAGDYVVVGNSSIGKQSLKVLSVGNTTITSVGGNVTGGAITLTFDSVYKLSTDYTSNTVNRQWEFNNQFDLAPGISTYQSQYGANTSVVDEVHVVVVDEDGKFSGTPGTVIEKFSGLSRASDAKTADGATNYYKTVLNNSSAYVWAGYDITGFTTGTAATVTSMSASIAPYTASLQLGASGGTESTIPVASLATAYDLFGSAELVDISLVMVGKARGGTNGEQLANYVIDNIAENRKDCVVFLSPEKADVVGNTLGQSATDVVTFRNSLRSTSYAVMDSGYKYQYDKYNDVYRFIPLNGDTAGVCARTDQTNDAWWSPAGTSRGIIKNIVKLAFNPTKADRDLLYKNGVNPVVTLPGQGTVLYGDKTLLAKPSAFDRINVRRLFIVLEKSIAKAAESTLFEFNDYFTRAQFRNMVEPFLRDVRGRRGIYDFKVVCDETNNTAEVIDTNRFVGDIYIKPARSINFIQLNFTAVRTGVEFSEIIGQ